MRYIIIHLILINVIIFGQIILEIPKSNEIINKMMMEILSGCYSNIRTLVIHGETDFFTHRSLFELESFAKIIYNNSSMINNIIEFQRKFDLFITTVETNEEFQEILLTFKYSPGWNIMGSFFILDQSNQFCNNAIDYLYTAWKMNIVISFFLCINLYKIPEVYTYNPYTNRAPKSWNEVLNTTKQFDGWTMYSRQYQVENICDGLKFDRTKYLDGANVRIVTSCHSHCTWIKKKYYNESVMHRLQIHDSLMIKAIKMSLNVTLTLSFDSNDNGDNDEPQGYLKYTYLGWSDLSASWRSPTATYNLTKTYPMAYSEIVIATNNRGYYSPLEKIKKYYGKVTLISMFIILLTTFIVIMISDKKFQYSFAAFEILRLLVNTSLHSQMKTVSHKIFFSTIFLYFLIFHATFQGHLAAFLTRFEYRKSAEILEDLIDSRYDTIYTYPGTSVIIKDPLLKKKMITGHIACGIHLIHHDNNACVTDIIFVVDSALDYKFHLSKKSITSSKYVYTTRDDWPLKYRLDMILKWLEQAGLSEKWVDMFTEKYKIQRKIRNESSKEFRPVSLSSLKFAFYIWIIGLGFASIWFVIEKLIYQKNQLIIGKYVKTKTREDNL